MSAGQQLFSSVSGADALNSPQSEMETLRIFLNQRLTEAVEDILSLFGKTVARYRERLDCQQRQLDSLRTGEKEEWSRTDGQLL